jgi:hypothetical protein
MSRLHSLQRRISVSPLRYAHHLPHRQRVFRSSGSSGAACAAREGDPFGVTTDMSWSSLVRPHSRDVFHIRLRISQSNDRGDYRSVDARSEDGIGGLGRPWRTAFGATGGGAGCAAEKEERRRLSRRRCTWRGKTESGSILHSNIARTQYAPGSPHSERSRQQRHQCADTRTQQTSVLTRGRSETR